jgi:hypothetical protein
MTGGSCLLQKMVSVAQLVRPIKRLAIQGFLNDQRTALVIENCCFDEAGQAYQAIGNSGFFRKGHLNPPL